MTDDQLLRAARRVITEACGLLRQNGDYIGGDNWTCQVNTWGEPIADCIRGADDVDAAAVAILREEMDKAKAENYALAEQWFPFIPHPNDDDPTKSFVTTTESDLDRVYHDSRLDEVVLPRNIELLPHRAF